MAHKNATALLDYLAHTPAGTSIMNMVSVEPSPSPFPSPFSFSLFLFSP